MDIPVTTNPRYTLLEHQDGGLLTNPNIPPRSSETTTQGFTFLPVSDNHARDVEEALPSMEARLAAQPIGHPEVSDKTLAPSTSTDNSENELYDAQQAIGGRFIEEFREITSKYKERYCEIALKYWLWETAACILSTLCLGSIIGILAYEDQKQLDEWTWKISPTAVVSFIGILAKSSLALVLSSLFSQMKWTHFRKAKSLNHLKMIDAASRGPWGAAQVVLYSKKVSLSLVAILVIASLLSDPFIQLVFSFPSRMVEDTAQRATIQRLTFYQDIDQNFTTSKGLNYSIPSEILWSSINRGFTSEEVPLTVNCPSGNCTWPESIKTLAVCGSCSDIAATTVHAVARCTNTSRSDNDVKFLQTSNYYKSITNNTDNSFLTCKYNFSGGLDLSYYNVLEARLDSLYRTLWSSSPWTSTSPYDVEYISNYTSSNHTTFRFNETIIKHDPSVADDDRLRIWRDNIVHFGALRTLSMTKEDWHRSLSETQLMPVPQCSGCEFYWCEKLIEQLQVTNGQPPTYITSNKRLWSARWDVQNNGANNYTAYLFSDDDLKAMKASDEWEFSFAAIQSKGTEGVESVFRKILGRSYYLTDALNYGSSNTLNLAVHDGAVASLVYASDLNQSIQRIAASISEAIRNSDGSEIVPGKVYVSRTFIHVRWAWLALPLGLLLLTSIMLVLVAVNSKRNQIALWKDDPTALLMHHTDLSDVHMRPAALSNLADKVHVRLDKDTFTFMQKRSVNVPEED